MTEHPVEILLVEDNPGDIKLTLKAFERSKLLNRMHVVTDGAAALAYLRRAPPYEDAARPDLILLDINLPKVSGLEVLEEVKADPNLRQIPIIILTSSEREADVRRAYDGHVNSYITKPPSFGQLQTVVEELEDYWFVLVRRPNEEP